jgi:hypothetical protein
MKNKLVEFFGLVFMGYLIIGVAHAFFFSFTLSRVKCLDAHGLAYVYCNVGQDWAWGIVVMGWPYYWLS